MKPDVKAVFASEMDHARSAEASGDLALSKRHLERAHILGQRWYVSHMKTHFHMLRLALGQSDTKEALGQLVRLIGAAPFHLAGWVPVGNTGGADVPATRPMPIPPDLQPCLEGHSLRNGLIARGALLAALAAAFLLSGR
ncbi:DUF3703 domain-containing protein [Sphingopyxis sp. CCNWLW253]|uniref:DUF3703 domain-containing protein n=1 Tax=unclassified Sphingopyxis TaxID=2614943 RepID=UPI003012A9AD